jgi:hypothetical protein
VLVARLEDKHLLSFPPEAAVRMLFSITSFETFDAMTRTDQPPVRDVGEPRGPRLCHLDQVRARQVLA